MEREEGSNRKRRENELNNLICCYKYRLLGNEIKKKRYKNKMMKNKNSFLRLDMSTEHFCVSKGYLEKSMLQLRSRVIFVERKISEELLRVAYTDGVRLLRMAADLAFLKLRLGIQI